MSSEKKITSYLQEGSVVLEFTKLRPLKKAIDSTSNIKNWADIKKVFSNHKKVVINATQLALASADDDLFGDTSKPSRTNSPVKRDGPKTTREAKSFLKKLTGYLDKKLPGLKAGDVDQVFDASLVVVVKALGTVGFGVSLGLLNAPIVIPIALILTITCIINAVEQTKDMRDKSKVIDVKSASKNVISGFKRWFTTLKLEKEQGRFAIGTAIITAFLIFIRTKVFKTKVIGAFSVLGKGLARGIWGIKDFVANAGGEIPWLTGIKGSYEKTKKAIWSPDGSTIIKDTAKDLNTGLIKKFGDVAGKKIKQHDLAPPKSLSSALSKGKFHGTKIGELTIKVAIPIICGAIIMYLFAEMVDNYNLSKVKQSDVDGREEFEKTL